jgi:hypothetical protein
MRAQRDDHYYRRQLAANLGMVLIVGAALALVHHGRHDLQAVSALIIAVLGSAGLIVGIAVRRGVVPICPRYRRARGRGSAGLLSCWVRC